MKKRCRGIESSSPSNELIPAVIIGKKKLSSFFYICISTRFRNSANVCTTTHFEARNTSSLED